VPGRSIGVLIVDDQVVYQRAAASIVDVADGFHVAASASSGEEALEVLGSQGCELVLMDVRMPGMGGIDAATVIRSRFPRSRVLLMSASCDGAGLAAVCCGEIGYISKAELGPDTLQAWWDTLAGEAGPSAV
jgi:DNA-binding NarL/FixJ family response regulator